MRNMQEYRESPWRLVAVYLAACLFLGVGTLLRGGFWVVGGVGGGVCLLMALYSTFVGRVKIRLTETGLDYKTFGVVIPYSAIHEVRLASPSPRPDASVADCVWIRIDPGVANTFGLFASRAVVKRSDGTVWLPVGLVGQPECKGSLFSELGKRVKVSETPPSAGVPAGAPRQYPAAIPLTKWKFRKALGKVPVPSEVTTGNHSGDSVAAMVDWSPLRSSGAKGKTRKLVRINDDTIEFKAASNEQGWLILTLVMGVGVMAGSLLGAVSVVGIIFGMGVSAFAIIRWHFGRTPIVFDKQKGIFRKGRKVAEAYARLDEIHAIQVISSYFSSTNRPFTSYEINLVMNDASRKHVFSSGDGSSLRKDAETLAAFLEISLWCEKDHQ